MTEPNTLLEAESVAVKYGAMVALEGFSLKAAQGEGVALLGLNGAGKTSALRALLRMTQFHGSIRWFGSEAFGPASLHRVGFAPEDASPPEFLTVGEYLSFIASFRVSAKADRKAEVDRWLGLFELMRDKRISACSKGMRRRVVLAQALIGKPEVVVLDEPLNGLDPVIIIRLREELLLLRKSGVLLIYSSHILAEVEKSCSRALFLRGGRVTTDLPMDAIVNQHHGLEKAFTEFATGGGIPA